MNKLRWFAAALILAFNLTAITQAKSENIEIGNVEEINLALYGTVAIPSDSTKTTMFSPMS